MDDWNATSAMLPANISKLTPEASGSYAYYWSPAADVQVVQILGDFSLTLGERSLQSQESVIWMQKRRLEQTDFYKFDVLLSRRAQIRDAAGTVTSGPVLFVTLNSAHPLILNADVTVAQSSQHTTLFQMAEKVRQQVIAGGGADHSGAVSVIDEAGNIRPVDRPEARAVVRHTADQEMVDQKRGIITATGSVYVSQGLVDSGEFMELRADAAVLFLRQADKSASTQPAPQTAPEESDPFPVEVQPRPEPGPGSAAAMGIGGLNEGVGEAVVGVYLQGDVVLTRGERMIRAGELYYDFENSRALILDAVMRAVSPTGSVPIYVRAQQVRQLSSTEYYTRQGIITSSEFYTPHVAIGAERVRLTDVTPRDEAGNVTGLMAGKYEAHDVTLNTEGVPIAYWPYVKGDFRQSETSLRSFRTAYSDNDGVMVQSKWEMFNLLGVDAPMGVDGTLRLDYLSKRGPGVGTDIDYETPERFGLLRGYYIYDEGEDNLGPFRSGPPDTQNRGRLTMRHREILGDGWELTLEGSYLSDPTFLEEYFRREFYDSKEQETLAYLKKQQDNWAATGLVQARALDFLTQTEHWPDLTFHLVGEPLGELASYYNESRFGFVKYLPDNRRLIDKGRINDNTDRTDLTMRADTRNELDIPLKLGTVNVVPYAMGRGGYWDGSADGGSRDRLFGSAGVRVGSEFWRLFEQVQSSLLDVNGVRHIIQPEATGWISQTNTDRMQLSPFDSGVEDIDDFYGSSLALRQRWQTKRGGAGNWRVVDWITFNLEFNTFGNVPKYLERTIGRFYDSRPEDSTPRNHVRADGSYRISDTTMILADANWDMNDGTLDLMDISYAVERSPRMSYFIGYRRIADTDSNLIGLGTNYDIDEKHRVMVRTYYDMERSKLEQMEVTLVRKMPRWYAGLTFQMDRILDDFNVGVTVWPEGAPQAAIGNKRYVNLAQSTGIRPEE